MTTFATGIKPTGLASIVEAFRGGLNSNIVPVGALQ
jgi:hypothetical protein